MDLDQTNNNQNQSAPPQGVPSPSYSKQDLFAQQPVVNTPPPAQPQPAFTPPPPLPSQQPPEPVVQPEAQTEPQPAPIASKPLESVAPVDLSALQPEPQQPVPQQPELQQPEPQNTPTPLDSTPQFAPTMPALEPEPQLDLAPPAAPTPQATPELQTQADPVSDLKSFEQEFAQQISQVKPPLDQPISTSRQPVEADKSQTQTPSQPAAANSDKVLPKILLTAGPLFLVASLAISLLMTNNPPTQTAETYLQEVASIQNEPVDRSMIKNAISEFKSRLSDPNYQNVAPDNPIIVNVYTDSSKQTKLQNSSTTSSDKLSFSWDPSIAIEDGANIIGYRIYLGTDSKGESLDTNPYITHPDQVIQVNSPAFDLSSYGIILQNGEHYYFYIQTVSDGQADLGFDRTTNTPANYIFDFIYEQ